MDNILLWVRPVLATTPTRWTNLIEALPVQLLTQAPAPGEWSALECLQHLIDTERWVFPMRVKAFLAGQNFPAFDPDSQGAKPSADQTPAVLAAEFAQLRVASLEILSQVTPSDLDRKAIHGELGPVTLNEMVHEWAGHDLMHTVQAERALMQPFIRGCGPWLRYFTDHIAQ
jgi:hypothetical protein